MTNFWETMAKRNLQSLSTVAAKQVADSIFGATRGNPAILEKVTIANGLFTAGELAEQENVSSFALLAGQALTMSALDDVITCVKNDKNIDLTAWLPSNLVCSTVETHDKRTQGEDVRYSSQVVESTTDIPFEVNTPKATAVHASPTESNAVANPLAKDLADKMGATAVSKDACVLCGKKISNVNKSKTYTEAELKDFVTAKVKHLLTGTVCPSCKNEAARLVSKEKELIKASAELAKSDEVMKGLLEKIEAFEKKIEQMDVLAKDPNNEALKADLEDKISELRTSIQSKETEYVNLDTKAKANREKQIGLINQLS